MSDDDKKLTTSFGAPVPNNQDVVTAGPRGPMLLQGLLPEALHRVAVVLSGRGIPASYRQA